LFPGGLVESFFGFDEGFFAASMAGNSGAMVTEKNGKEQKCLPLTN
jgi:hypothetical protein